MISSDSCWKKIPSLGNINAYASAIQQFPILTAEQEQECAGSKLPEDKARLILSHLRLAYSLARAYQYVMPISDAVQEANIGLITAAERFESGETRFCSYATLYINAALKSAYISSFGQTRISQSKPVRKLFWNLPREKRLIKNETGRDNLNESDIAALAEKLNVPADDIRTVDVYMSGSNNPVLLDHTIHDEEDS